jgi:hypothetical protein
MSAIVSIALLGISIVTVSQSSAILQLANSAKAQADNSVEKVKKANERLDGILGRAQVSEEQITGMAKRMGAVESVLTQVDLNTGGRKLCMAFKEPTWDDLSTGRAAPMPLYVPSKWPITACRSQAISLKLDRFRLGCIFADHASIGEFISVKADPTGAIPRENCGW